MEDLITFLIIAFIIVGPLLEKLLKGGKRPPQQPPQRQRRSRPAERQRLPDGRTTTVSGPAGTGSEASSGDASDLLPAELWEILTGQRRAEPTPSEPAPEPARDDRPAEVRPSLAERRAAAERKRAARLQATRRESKAARGAGAGGLADEDAAVAELMRSRERSQATRRQYDHSFPQVVSLETEPAPEPIRHAAFHERLDRLPKAPRRRSSPGPIDLDLDFDDTSSLQRAILLQEVLGRPKGLD